ncbi:MAG TPA: hypothetical protein VLG09_05325, partial [Candidatus Saccharimonadales bacterium]|nr:hypothetical protein [Candidatus Saccharimonadales bacterium]
LMSLAGSNILASVAVVGLPVVGSWIAPKLSLSLRYFFFTLTLCGIPFVIGQYSQEDEWGPIWVQYHLLDLSYVPWGTAVVMCLLLIGARVLGKDVRRRTLLGGSFLATVAFGYLSEFWDTMWTWYDGEPLAKAVDGGDYITITAGVVVTAVFYVWFQRTASKEAS